MPEETVGAADTASCDCEPCKRKHGLPHSVAAGRIHEYTSTPRNGWRPRYTAAEVAADPADRRPPTFGVELETDAPSFRLTDLPDRPFVGYLPMGADAAAVAEQAAAVAARNAWDVRNERHRARQRRRFAAAGNMTAEEAVSVAAPHGFWHPKHDGSVSGPEFASQPGTLAYWRSQRSHIAGMLKALLHGGMRSHDGDRCGFHVNIGSDAFGSGRIGYGATAEEQAEAAAHLVRFATLVCMNERWSVRMSQRTHTSARWAAFDEWRSPADRQRIATTWARDGYAYVSHTSVLNVSHEGRVEFRLPRGTLRLDRFYAKLEWVASMLEYTRNPHSAIQPSAYMRWARATGEYPALVAYMTERFSAERFAEPAPAEAPVAPAAPADGALSFEDGGAPCEYEHVGGRCGIARDSHASVADGASHDWIGVCAATSPGGIRCARSGAHTLHMAPNGMRSWVSVNATSV